MKKAVVIGLGIAGVAGLVYVATNYAKKVANQFGFEISSFGVPGFINGKLVLPIIVEFTNPTPVDINPDNVHVEVFILKNNQWVPGAKVNQPVTLPSGTSQQKINTEVDLKSIFGGNVFDTITNVLTTYNSKNLPVHVEVTVTYEGIDLPTQTFNENVSLA